MSKITIAVIFGGVSSEHEVSYRSARAVMDHIDREKFEPIAVYIDKSGCWHLADCLDFSVLKGTAIISPDRSHGLVLIDDKSHASFVHIDAAFPVLHGKNGEDGTIQGLFTLAGIPFVGCGCLASAACMDKAVANIMFDNAGVPHCKWVSLDSRNALDPTELERAEGYLGYPMFVKPANAGSSVGVTKAKDRAALIEAIELALIHDRKIVIEECVYGQEIECAVCGNENPVASILGEILPPDNEFYSYDEKYTTSTTGLKIPAGIDDAVSDKVRELAVKAYTALGCEGLSRCDFFLPRGTVDPVINEINTIPGFTSISMYPKLMEKSGTDFTSLVTRLIELAIERGAL